MSDLTSIFVEGISATISIILIFVKMLPMMTAGYYALGRDKLGVED